MINALIVDLITTSEQHIEAAHLQSIDDVRQAGPLICFSDAMAADAALLKRFLYENLYRHYQVNRMTSKARRIVSELFTAFMQEPKLLAPDYLDASGNPAQQARKIADYIAGMTDRYAIREHRRLFLVDEI